MAKVVLAFGSFDILHPGHLLYLERARRLGSKLIVVVARDESIRMFKKREPVFGQNDRVRMLKALKVVDEAVVGNKLRKSSDRYNIIRKYKPSVIVFGYDQKVNIPSVNDWLKSNGMRAKVVRISTKYKTSRYKSSKIAQLL